MRVEQFIIGLFIFSLFVVAGSMIFYSTASDYNTNPDMDLFKGAQNESGVYAVLDDTYNEVAVPSQSRMIGEDSVNVGADQTADVSLITGAFRVIKLIPKTFTLIDAVIKDIAIALHVPPFFITFMSGVFLISIIFSIIYLIWRLKA